MKKKGIALTKSQKTKIEKLIKNNNFDKSLLVTSQIVGNSIVRVLASENESIYFSVDGNYYLYNFSNNNILQYNTSEKNQINQYTDLEWKEVC